jgi:hypothetical protein
VGQLTTPLVSVTVTGSPAPGAIGGTFTVTYTNGGITNTVSQTTEWPESVDLGTTVTVSDPQDIINDGTGVRYKFDHCDPSCIVTMDVDTTITLVYTTEYKVTYAQTGCSLSVSLPADEWVASGDPATGTFPSPVTDTGTQCLFKSDDRPDSITGATTILGTYETSLVTPPGATVNSKYFGRADPDFTGLMVKVDKSSCTTTCSIEIPLGGPPYPTHKLTAPRTWRVNGVTFRFAYWELNGATTSTRNILKYALQPADTLYAVYSAPVYSFKVYVYDDTTKKPIQISVSVSLDTDPGPTTGVTGARGRLTLRVTADPFNTHTLKIEDPNGHYKPYEKHDLSLTGNRTIRVYLEPT